MIPQWVNDFNAGAWIASNILVLYIAVMLVVFVASYYILFDPRATTAGRFIFRFSVSLIGVIGLVFISLFIDPKHGHEWFSYPGDVLAWRPLIRLIAYAYVAYTVTGLTVLLVIRKWRPDRLRTARDRELITPRSHP